jgi:cbb3-type cytochrome oxidase cytochrome c subunit
MSDKNQNASAGFTHEKVETNNFLMIVLILLVIAIGGLVEIVPLFFQKSTTEAVTGVQPYSSLQLMGRDVYIREGCYNCHSQMIRPFRAETCAMATTRLLANSCTTIRSSGAANAPALICIVWAESTATNGIAFT